MPLYAVCSSIGITLPISAHVLGSNTEKYNVTEILCRQPVPFVPQLSVTTELFLPCEY